MKPIPIALKPGTASSIAQTHGLALLRLAFRPFYLCAALFACLAVPLWVAVFFGQITLNTTLAPVLWHAHEMLFGFAVAVIVGFLLTAGKAWTGLATPRGGLLGALATLWISARIAALVAPYPIYATLDLLLLPIVAVILGNVLMRAGNRRNLPLVLILVLLSLVNLAFHLSVLGRLDLPPLQPLYAGLALIVLLECVMAGRVVPAFTMSVTPGLKLKPPPALEVATLSLTALALALWIFAPAGWITLIAFLLASVLHLLRQWHWQSLGTRKRPILWILHAACVWFPVGFALLGLAQIGWVSVSAGVHALTVGATGGLVMGMITRTARGHTGRPIQASNPEVLAYALVLVAAALRSLMPLLAPQWFAHWLIGAAVAWSAAFAIYLYVFTPWLFKPRLDGKDG